MHKLDQITKIPIIILSNPRTGSTALLRTIGEKFNISAFNEPSMSKKKDSLSLFLVKNKRFVVKEHTKNFIKDFVFLLNFKPFVIRLRRKDILEQILSNYIASIRKIYGYENIKEISNYKNEIIKLDEKLLNESIFNIKEYNNATDSYQGKVDLDIFYEDIKDELQGTITPYPKNYTELKEWVSKTYVQT